LVRFFINVFNLDTLHAVTALNVLGIVYERVKAFTIPHGYLLLWRAILLMWIIGLVCSGPSLASSTFEPDPGGEGVGNCEEVRKVKTGWFLS